MSDASKGKASPSWPLPPGGESIYIPAIFLTPPTGEPWTLPADGQSVWVPHCFLPAPRPALGSSQPVSAPEQGAEHRQEFDLMTCPICDLKVCDTPKLDDFVYHITDNHRPAKVANEKGRLVHVYKARCFVDGCNSQIEWVPKPWHLRTHIRKDLRDSLRDEITAFWPPSKPKARQRAGSEEVEVESS